MRASLLGSGSIFLCSAAATALTIRTSSVLQVAGVVAALGVLLLAVAALRPVARRFVAWVLMATNAAAAVVVGVRLGWPPTFVGLTFLWVVLAGLLVGARAALVVSGLIAAAMAAGGLAVSQGLLRYPAAPPEPAVWQHWVRVGLIILLLAGAASYLLSAAVGAARRAHAQAIEALAHAEEMARQAETERAARLDEERRLLRAQKQLTVRQLSGGVGHHVNNLLTVGRMAAEQAEDAQSLAQVHEAGQLIMDAVDEGSGVLTDLMRFSRNEPGDTERLDVATLLQTVRAALSARTRDDQLLEVEAAEDLVLQADPDAVRQLVMNLALNALDALPRGGEVLLSATLDRVDAPPEGALGPLAPGTYVALRVADQGVGMDADALRLAPTAFYTTKAPTRHPGLGLSTAFGIARSARGTLALHSSPGAGTVVTAWLPPTADSEPHARIWSPPLAPPLDRTGHAQAPEPLVPARPGAPESASAGEARRAPAPPPDTAARGPGVSPVRRASRHQPLAQQEAYLARRLLAVSSVCLLLAAALTAATSFWLAMPFLFIGGLVSAWGARARRTDRARRLTLVGVLWIPLIPSWISYAFLAPGILYVLFLAVVLAAVFGSRWLRATSLALATVLFVVAGALYTTGTVTLDVELFAPSTPGNWYRVGASLLLGNLFLVASSQLLLRRARAGIDAVRSARRDLDVQQAERDRETRRRLEARRMAAASEQLQVSAQLAGAVAHDLRNALQQIMLGAEELTIVGPPPPPHSGDGEIDREDLSAVMASLQESLDYALALVNQLDLSGDLDDEPDGTVIDLAAVVARALRLYEGRLGREIRLEQTLTPETFIPASSRDVQRIVMNLVQNARHAMPDGGVLTVQAHPDTQAGRVELRVADTGHGMDAATAARAFDAFFTTKEVGAGTGLGLTAVRDAAERSGASVHLESSPGEGTTVVVTWPEGTPSPGSEAAAQPSADNPLERHTVLIAEDHDVIRGLLLRSLEQAGLQVLVAADGDEASRLIAERPDIDLLFVDGIMPGRPTRELIEAFRATNPRKPVVLASGYLPDDLQRWGVLREDLTFMAKPLRGTTVLQTIRTLL